MPECVITATCSQYRYIAVAQLYGGESALETSLLKQRTCGFVVTGRVVDLVKRDRQFRGAGERLMV